MRGHKQHKVHPLRISQLLAMIFPTKQHMNMVTVTIFAQIKFNFFYHI